MKDFFVYLMLMGGLSSGPSLPFWASAGQYGIVPEENFAQGFINIKTEFDDSKTFQYRFGGSVGANFTGQEFRCKPFVDELYGSARWKVFTLDLGMKRTERDFLGASERLGSLSTTAGHVIWSANARSMPGYNITLSPLAIPFTGEHLFILGEFGDYKTLDKRYMEGTLVHSTKAFLQARFAQRWALTLGLDHYALWGGTDPSGNSMKVTFGNYLRMVTGQSAGKDGTFSDRANVIGDQGGAELVKVEYKGDGWKATAQHEIPYSDKSGMEFYNFPDGVNTLCFSFDDKNRWVSDILYEFTYTMYQSGPIHEQEFDENGNSLWTPESNFKGGDDYFNNGEYQSGWTHFGRTIGIPLFYPLGTHDGTRDPEGIVKGVENNRIKAHHIGLGGKLFRKAPYRLMLTWSRNYGIYPFPYAGESAWQKPWGSVKETPLHQFSAGLSGEIPLFKGLEITYGIYADKGAVLKDVMGVLAGVSYSF